MSFASIQNELSADEMRGIMAGSDVSYTLGGTHGHPVGDPTGNGYIQLDPFTVTAPGNQNYTPIIGTGVNPYGTAGVGSYGGGGSSGGSGGSSGGVVHTDPVPYDPKATHDPYQTINNIVNSYNYGVLTWQNYKPGVMTHSVTAAEQGVLSANISKGMAALGLALDSHNFSMSLATNLSTEAGIVLKGANKATGAIGLVLGAITAADDIYKNGGNLGDYMSIGLGLASIALMIAQPEVAVAEGAGLAIAALSIVNDAEQMAGNYNQ